jgi:5-oxoprolinase (ATP-hydrolysing) subunit A
MRTLDLNCDMGEGFGPWKMGDDAGVLPFVTSANIACGFHAGDPALMRRVVAGCIEHGVAIGAHPSYFDREGFGRRAQAMATEDVQALVLYQVAALDGIARAAGARLHHVKPHGALYNRAAEDRDTAVAIVRAIAEHDRRLIVYGLAGSELTAAAERAGLAVAHEAFAERRYEADGKLSPRGLPGAVIETLADALVQVQALLRDGRVTARCGEPVAIRADTLCLHGDRADAVEFAHALRAALEAAGVVIRAPQPMEPARR